MKRLELDKDLFLLLDGSYFFNSGFEGRIYFNPFDGSKLLKIYNKYIESIRCGLGVSDDKHELRYEALSLLRDEFRELVLPLGYINYKNCCVGPIIDRVNGVLLRDFLYFNPSSFYRIFILLNELLERLSKKNIYLIDIASFNVLVDYFGNIKIIDCDFDGLIFLDVADNMLKGFMYDNFKVCLKDFMYYFLDFLPLSLREMIDNCSNCYSDINNLIGDLEIIRRRA